MVNIVNGRLLSWRRFLFLLEFNSNSECHSSGKELMKMRMMKREENEEQNEEKENERRAKRRCHVLISMLVNSPNCSGWLLPYTFLAPYSIPRS